MSSDIRDTGKECKKNTCETNDRRITSICEYVCLCASVTMHQQQSQMHHAFGCVLSAPVYMDTHTRVRARTCTCWAHSSKRRRARTARTRDVGHHAHIKFAPPSRNKKSIKNAATYTNQPKKKRRARHRRACTVFAAVFDRQNKMSAWCSLAEMITECASVCVCVCVCFEMRCFFSSVYGGFCTDVGCSVGSWFNT